MVYIKTCLSTIQTPFDVMKYTLADYYRRLGISRYLHLSGQEVRAEGSVRGLLNTETESSVFIEKRR
jgi:hypothetical protein